MTDAPKLIDVAGERHGAAEGRMSASRGRLMPGLLLSLCASVAWAHPFGAPEIKLQIGPEGGHYYDGQELGPNTAEFSNIGDIQLSSDGVVYFPVGDGSFGGPGIGYYTLHGAILGTDGTACTSTGEGPLMCY